MPHLTDHTSQETLLFFNHASQFLGKLLPTVTSSESYITSQGILFLVGNNMGAVSVTEERARERERAEKPPVGFVLAYSLPITRSHHKRSLAITIPADSLHATITLFT